MRNNMPFQITSGTPKNSSEKDSIIYISPFIYPKNYFKSLKYKSNNESSNP